MDGQNLVQEARKAAKWALAASSAFPVGAAILLADGMVVTGANVELPSHGQIVRGGLTCAERAGLARAALKMPIGQPYTVKAIAVSCVKVAGQSPLSDCTPCGACRQVMRDYIKPDTPEDIPIYIDQGDASAAMTRVLELLPEGFQLLRPSVPPKVDIGEWQEDVKTGLISGVEHSLVPDRYCAGGAVVRMQDVDGQTRYFAGARVMNGCTNLSIMPEESALYEMLMQRQNPQLERFVGAVTGLYIVDAVAAPYTEAQARARLAVSAMNILQSLTRPDVPVEVQVGSLENKYTFTFEPQTGQLISVH